MGYNTTVVVLNDGLDDISRDPNFGRNLADACTRIFVSKKMINVPACGFVNPVSVIETHHADMTAVVAVGGNYGTRIDSIFGSRHHEPEDQLRIVRKMAEHLGYDLRKRKTS